MAQLQQTTNDESRQTVMVELVRGYGDGYGIVRRRNDGQFADLTGDTVLLRDGGVRVPTGAIRKILGPLDCPAAIRVHAERYTRAWSDNRFVALASDGDLLHAMTRGSEPEIYDAMRTLRSSLASE